MYASSAWNVFFNSQLHLRYGTEPRCVKKLTLYRKWNLFINSVQMFEHVYPCKKCIWKTHVFIWRFPSYWQTNKANKVQNKEFLTFVKNSHILRNFPVKRDVYEEISRFPAFYSRWNLLRKWNSYILFLFQTNESFGFFGNRNWSIVWEWCNNRSINLIMNRYHRETADM